MRRSAFLVAMTVGVSGFLCLPAHTVASDFWDEVKRPGLRAWRTHILVAQQELNHGTQWRTGAHLALERTELAIRLMPNEAEGPLLRAVALCRLDREPEAMEQIERALELDASIFASSPHLRGITECAAQFARLDLAARILEPALTVMRLSTLRGDLYAAYGDILQALGPTRIEEAVLAYREALRGSAQSEARAAIGLLLALRRLNRFEDEADWLRTLVPQVDDPLLGFVGFRMPESEIAARRAMISELRGNLENAQRQWEAVTGPWRDQAVARTNALRSPRRRR